VSDYYAPNQQAVRADGSGPAEEGTGGSGAGAGDQDQEKSLDAMTKDELLEEAQARGVDADSSMTKAEIREAIGA
jgi:hypothetical protein